MLAWLVTRASNYISYSIFLFMEPTISYICMGIPIVSTGLYALVDGLAGLPLTGVYKWVCNVSYQSYLVFFDEFL